MPCARGVAERMWGPGCRHPSRSVTRDRSMRKRAMLATPRRDTAVPAAGAGIHLRRGGQGLVLVARGGARPAEGRGRCGGGGARRLGGGNGAPDRRRRGAEEPAARKKSRGWARAESLESHKE